MDDYQPNDLSKSRAFELVKDERRRHVVRLVRTADHTYNLDDLAIDVAAKLNGGAPDDVATGTKQKLAVTLLHHDLPQLDEQDIVDVDTAARTVDSGENIGDLSPLV